MYIHNLLYNLPKDFQEKILNLSSEHGIALHDAKRYFLMGGEHADLLCKLKSSGEPESFIELQNRDLWHEKNKKIMKEFESL